MRSDTEKAQADACNDIMRNAKCTKMITKFRSIKCQISSLCLKWLLTKMKLLEMNMTSAQCMQITKRRLIRDNTTMQKHKNFRHYFPDTLVLEYCSRFATCSIN